MTSDIPWRFRGLRPEVREAARQAARRAGVPVGEWLNEIIIDSAAEEGVYPAPAAPETPPAQQVEDQQAHDDLAAIKKRLEELSRQLDRLSQPLPGAEAATETAPDAEPEALVSTSRPADEPAAAVSAPAVPASAPPQAASPTSEPDDYAIRLDQAVAEIRSRRRALDSEPVQATGAAIANVPPNSAGSGAGLEQQLREINRNIAGLRQPCGAAEAVASLRGDLAEIASLLKSALPQRAIELLEAEIRNLTKRIDEQRDNGGSAAAIANLESGLAEMREQLKVLKPAESLATLEAATKELSRLIDQGGVQSNDTAALTQLDDTIASLRSAVGNVASTEAVSRIADDIQALSAKVDAVASSAGGGNELLTSLEKRISAMADTLEKHNSHCGKGSAHLEDVLTLLVDRLEQPPAPGGDPAALHQLGDRLATVTNRLDDLQPANVDLAALRKIEDSITAIVEQFDPQALQQIESRIVTLTNQLVQTAQSARTAPAGPGPVSLQQLEGQIANLLGKLDQPPPAAPEPAALRQIEGRIETLFEKLDDISRTSSDPAALRDLEHRIAAIADKLDASDARFAHLEAIEQGLAGVLAHVEDLRAGQAESLMRAAMPSTDNRAVDAIKRELDALKHTEQRTQTSIEAVHGTLGHVVDRLSTIENDLRRRSAGAAESTPVAPAPAPAVARIEPAPVPVAPAAPPKSAASTAAPSISPPASDPSARLNFIAAARRAAQAAAAEPARETSRTQTGRDPEGGLGTRPKGKPSPTRSIIVGISILVILLGATHFVWDFLATPDTSTTASVPEAVPVPKPESSAPADAKPASADRRFETPDPADRQHTAAANTVPVAVPAQSPIIPEATPVDAVASKPSSPAATGTVATDNRSAFAIPPAEPLQALPVAAPIAAAPTTAAPVAEKPAAVAPVGFTSSVPDRHDSAATLPAAIGSTKLREAALAGNAAAQFEVANRFAEGRGVAQNVAEAARWFERAAEQDLTPAQFQIASLYEKGRGVKKNLQAARRYYAAAAKGGNAKAMHNLAVLYAEGLAGKSDYATAAMWFRMAANRGVTDSQYNLGILYARGIGVDRNLEESYKWFALAAKRGDKDAESKRDDVSTQLDEAAQKAAERAVASFVPEPQPNSAIKVSRPAGGWDRPDGGASATKSQDDKSGSGRPKTIKRSSKS